VAVVGRFVPVLAAVRGRPALASLPHTLARLGMWTCQEGPRSKPRPVMQAHPTTHSASQHTAANPRTTSNSQQRAGRNSTRCPAPGPARAGQAGGSPRKGASAHPGSSERFPQVASSQASLGCPYLHVSEVFITAPQAPLGPPPPPTLPLRVTPVLNSACRGRTPNARLKSHRGVPHGMPVDALP